MDLFKRLTSMFRQNTTQPSDPDTDSQATGTNKTRDEPANPTPPEEIDTAIMDSDELVTIGEQLEEDDKIRINDRLEGTVMGVEGSDALLHITVEPDNDDDGTIQLSVSTDGSTPSGQTPITYMNIDHSDPQWSTVYVLEHLGTDE